jgi:hypothetical protein
MPLKNAHSHNDYEHTRPLLDALERGFCSVEADVWAVEGRLLVAHNRNNVQPERTLQALYLDPLLERVRRNRGRVYREASEFVLLVEFKSPAEECYPLLRELLQGYRAMLTEFRAKGIRRRAISILITGNLPRAQMEADKTRLMALEGDASDLESTASVALMPQISMAWGTRMRWLGVGTCPEEERLKLRDMATKAHQAGRKIRFWGVFNTPDLWREEVACGVDWLNIDQLDKARDFLLQKPLHAAVAPK